MLSSPEVRERAATLRGGSPETILAWAVATFPERTALTVSFGGGGVVLAHMLRRINPGIPVLFLDTGFHFPETLAFKDEFAERYGLNLVELHPATDPGPLYKTDPDRCCWIRKVEPLQRALTGCHAVVKVFPLAGWSREDVWSYIREEEVPYHPLLDQGFTSIGCWPCTRATRPGEPERAGRWSGMGKTECGLHTFTVKV